MNIKTIDIEAIEFTQKDDDGYYFTGLMHVNKNLHNNKTFLIPMRYSYKEEYVYEAKKLLIEFNLIEQKYNTLNEYCKKEGIILKKSLKRSANQNIIFEITAKYNEIAENKQSKEQ